MTRSRNLNRAARAAAASMLAVGLAVTAAGCASSSGDSSAGVPVAVISTPSSTSQFLATELAKPLPQPGIVLADTAGKPVSVASAMKGKIGVLYVGYTNCPDVCPTTMADIAVALRKLPEADRAKVAVVFVTTDPARDTSARIGQWLKSFDGDFVGLTGPYAKVSATAHAVGIPIEPPVTNPDGSITVEHGAQVLLYGTNGTSKLIFTSGFAAADLAHDLALLLKGTNPS